MLDQDPVGLVEIAQRLGVRRQTADNWRGQGLLPARRWTIGGRPAWSWPLDIRPWAEQTGRLPRKDTTMITYQDIHAKVHTAVNAGGEELAEGIDVDAITRELIDRYGLVDIDATTEDGDPVIDHDTFWELVRSHDATQQD